MYDELVKRLREAAEYVPCIMDREDAIKAADAIEELSKDRDNWKATAKEEREGYWHWFDNYQRDVPRWIPVTERLPDEGRYLALTTPSVNGGEPYARILRFSENLESIDRYDFEGINRSGWYYYDGEYGNIEVVTVTHWMPLPKAPEEG